jgi:glycosyltransferase involved in cell wall biosynthesis
MTIDSVMELKKPLQIYVPSGARTRSDQLDGSSRIFIECAKRWTEQGNKITVLMNEQDAVVFQRYGLTKINGILMPSAKFRANGGYLQLMMLYVTRTLNLCAAIYAIRPKSERVVVYSGSDFWPDSIPAWIFKLRNKKAKWIAGFYLFAPSPFSKESPYKRLRRAKGLLYYVSQIPIYIIMKKYADMVWVTNEPDRWRFIDNNRFTPERVVAVRGGVDTKTPDLIPNPEHKKFDAVFIGRFHPQKGVLELIDIWKYVCERKKDARLAMIGVGELENDVKSKIKAYKLEDKVTLFGFKDGVEKLKIFKESRVVVHPAIYDSGGMAACEAMACGLPGVSFDLPALKTYYPKGMLKTPCFNLKAFATNILKLLNDEMLYKKSSKDALDWARQWDWDKRADELLSDIQRSFTY